MRYDTDGNLAALRQYEREQDALDAQDIALENAQRELADALYDAYLTNNEQVIDEVNEILTEDEYRQAKMLTKLREAMSVEATRPAMGRGCEVYSAYMNLIDLCCMDIAERSESIEDIEKAVRFYGVDYE